MEPKNTSTYKEMMETIKQMEESADLLKELTYNSLKDDGYDIDALKTLSNEITENDLDCQPDESLVDIFKTIGDSHSDQWKDDEKIDDTIKELCKSFHETKDVVIHTNPDGSVTEETPEELEARLKVFDEKWDETKYTYMRRLLKQVFGDMKEIKKTYDEVDELKKQADEAINEYVDYISSEEYQEKKKERLDILRKQAEEAKDPKEKKRVEKLCNEMEASMNLSFVAKSIERLGENGYLGIKKSFFDREKSNYIMKRYHDKIEKFGYRDEVYGHFFGLEEKFLEEEYWVYDNLFLFFMMRFIAHADPKNKTDRLYVSALITNASNLVYNKFSSDSTREHYLDVIKDFLDHFKDDYELFNEKNVLHPNHPTRLAKKEKNDNQLKEMIYANLKDAEYEVTDEVKNMTLEELRVLYEGVLDDLSAKQKATSPINKVIENVHLNTDAYKRNEYRKKYMQYAELNDEVEEKIKTLSLEELDEFVNKAKDNFETSTVKNDEEKSDTEVSPE